MKVLIIHEKFANTLGTAGKTIINTENYKTGRGFMLGAKAIAKSLRKTYGEGKIIVEYYEDHEWYTDGKPYAVINLK